MENNMKSEESKVESTAEIVRKNNPIQEQKATAVFGDAVKSKEEKE